MSVRTKLEEATGLTAKKKETLAQFQLRLIEAVDDLSEEEYEALPDEARKWTDKAIRAYGKDKDLDDIPDFPSEKAEEPEVEEPEEEEEQEEETDDTDKEEDTKDDESDADEEEAEEASDTESSDDDEEEEETKKVTHTDVESSGRRYKSKASSSKAKAKAAAPAKASKSSKKEAAPIKTRKGGDNGGSGKGLDYARKLLVKDINISATDLRDKVKAAGYEVSDSTLSTSASGFRSAVRVLQNAGKLKSTMLDD